MTTEVSTDFTGILDGRPAPDRYEPPEEDKRLVTGLTERFEAAKKWRLPWDRQWELNKSFLKGDQCLARHKITGEIIRLSVEDSKKLRSQNNALRPINRSLNGKLSKLIPSFRVTPGSADFDEQNGVKAAEQTLQYWSRKEDLELVYQKMNGYLPWAGNSFAEVVWDPHEGRKVYFCDTCQYWTYEPDAGGQPCPQCTMQKEQEALLQQQATEATAMEGLAEVAEMDPSVLDLPPEAITQGIEVPQAPMEQLGPLPLEAPVPPLEEAREGDCKVRVRDVFDVFLPPGCTNILRASWYCVEEVVECSEASRRFPTFALFIQPDASIAQERADRQAMGPYALTTGGYEDLTNHVAVRQFHERPTEAYPFGRMLTTINGMLVEEKEEPAFIVGMNRFALYQFIFDPIEAELYGDAPLTHMVARQKELNILETQLREGVQLGLRKKVLVPLMSRINAEELTSESVQVIPYNNTAGDPKELVTSDLPQGVWNRKADLMADLRTLASITESEQGIMGTDPNGRAAAIINAEADQQVGPIVRYNNAEFREMHRAGLLFYRYFAHPDRTATTVGKEGTKTTSFIKLNLLQEGWDIVLDEVDSLSRNPAVRYQQVMELWQATGGQYFMDPMTGMVDWKKFNRMARLPDTETGYDTEAVEKATAAQIPDLLKLGIMWQPKSYDTPLYFAEVLGDWLRGPGRQEDPALVMQIEQIWQFYQMAQMAGMGQMMMQMGMGGQPSQPGSTMSATGGTPNGMSSMMGASNIGMQASGAVDQADQMGEQAASQSLGHEN